MRATASVLTANKALVSPAYRSKDATSMSAKAIPDASALIHQGAGHSFGTINVHNPDHHAARPVPVQPKLEINQPGDAYEREADDMADRVMRMPDTGPRQPNLSPLLGQKKRAGQEEAENPHFKSTDTFVQRSPENDSPVNLNLPEDWEDKQSHPPYLRIQLTMPTRLLAGATDMVNYGDANMELIQRGYMNPADYTIPYAALWNNNYQLSTNWRLGAITRNLYDKGDSLVLKPIRTLVNKIPVAGSFVSSRIKLDKPDLKGGDWDRYAADKLTLTGLGGAVDRDNPAYNADSGFTFTVNIVDSHFDENNLVKRIFRKPANPNIMPQSVGIDRKCAHCAEEKNALQMKRETGAGGGMAAPPVVHDVISAGGQPLDAGTRSFMESRFGYDFGHVRIHNDSLAHQSSAAINALAYTHGNHVVFGAGQYRPDSTIGRQLLAHELVHVVQQQNLQKRHIQRRITAESWAGKFAAYNYDAFYVDGGREGMEYGVGIEIFFEPNELVDAEKIAFVQTAQSLVDGSAIDIYADDGDAKAKVSKSRRVPLDAKVAPGTGIDQRPTDVSPVYGAYSLGADITNVKSNTAITMNSNEKPAKIMELGWRYVELDGEVISRMPRMTDEPNLIDENPDSPVSLEQNFESAVVALAGNQKGVYYGSVEWGWKKGANDIKPQEKPFKIKSTNVPSSNFQDAALRWNSSKNTGSNDSIKLSLPGLKTTKAKNTEFNDEQLHLIAKIGKGIPVEEISTMNILGASTSKWSKVIILKGSQIGKIGYMKNGDIA